MQLLLGVMGVNCVAFDKAANPVSVCVSSLPCLLGDTHFLFVLFCMLTSVDKMFIRFIFAKDMQLHYIWYYKILIKTSSCYPVSTVLFLFFISMCFSLEKKEAFLPPWVKPKPVICVRWWPSFGRDLINIATCCEGLAMDVPPCGSPSFRWLLLLGCCLSFHMDAFGFCSSELVLQHKLWDSLLNAATWPHTTNIPWTNVKSKETPVMDAASNIPVAVLALG